VGKAADERRSMTAAQHIGVADKLIETACALRLRAKTVIPDSEPVTLQIGEFTRVRADDELIHVRMGKVAGDEFELFRSIVPPLRDMWCLQPAPNHRQVAGRHRAERVCRHAQPAEVSVSMVTLRLV